MKNNIDENMNEWMSLFWHYDLYSVDLNKFDKLYDKVDEVIKNMIENKEL